MFTVRILKLPDNLEKLRALGPQLIWRLQQRMNLLMFMLESHIVGETIPFFFPKGATNIPATVRTHPAVVEGTVIKGWVDAGGPRTTKTTLHSGEDVDYAAVQEYGIDHEYVIRPFDKKALAFMMGNKQVIVRRVLHPPLTARPYMRTGLEDMKQEIIDGLNESISELVE